MKEASELTVAMRKLFAGSKGKIKYSAAKPLLIEQGFDLVADIGDDPEQHKKESNAFNVNKNLWKRAKVKAKAEGKTGGKKVGRPKGKESSSRTLCRVLWG